MSKDENGISIFYNLFSYCDVGPEILETLKVKYGIKFVKQVLSIDNGKFNLKLTSGAASHGGNYGPLANWILREFDEDIVFVKSILMTKDQIKNDILHIIVANSEIEKIIPTLNELKCLENFTNEKLLDAIILQINNYGRTFIQDLVSTFNVSKSEDEIIEILTELLKWVNQNTLCAKELLLSKDHNTESLIFNLINEFHGKKILSNL